MNTSAATRNPSDEIRPSLPQKKAFVLRFSEDTGPETGLFVGRIEHVTSGDQAVFSSVEQLFTFVRLTLAAPERPPVALPPGGRTAGPRVTPVRRPSAPAWKG